MANSPPRWEYLQSSNLTKSLTINKTRPTDLGSYGPDVINDDEKPEEIVTLESHGMDHADKEAERAKVMTRGTTFTYTAIDNKDGVTTESFTGYVVAVDAKRIKGMGYYDVTIRLRRTDI